MTHFSSRQAARRKHQEAEAALAAREAELASQRTSHQAETTELTTRLQEANTEREQLLDELRATQDKEGEWRGERGNDVGEPRE